MLQDHVRDLRDELLAESMRAATLVGLASIPAGFLWIALFGTGNGAVLVLTGVLVGVLYRDRSSISHRAGARAGIFAPLPELIVQSATQLPDFLAVSGSPIFVAVLAALVVLVFLVAWVLFASLVVFVALVTALFADALGPYLPGIGGSDG